MNGDNMDSKIYTLEIPSELSSVLQSKLNSHFSGSGRTLPTCGRISL